MQIACYRPEAVTPALPFALALTAALLIEAPPSLPGTRRGLVAQVKASFAAAATFQTRFILYVKPDKEAFFAGAIRNFVLDAAGDADVGIVLASRSRASFGTFPPMQRYTEGVINQLCSELVGCDGDYSYGPFLMNRTSCRGWTSCPNASGGGGATSCSQ